MITLKGGILGELGSMITLVGTAFYFVETAGGTAYMACMLEAKYPGISVNDEEKSRGGRPFIDNFPLAAFCLILTLVCSCQFSQRNFTKKIV